MSSHLFNHDAHPMVLSRRQRQIAALTAHGLRGRSIAELLGLKYKTVENTLRSVYQKLGLHDRVRLARWAIKHHVDTRTPLDVRRADQ